MKASPHPAEGQGGMMVMEVESLPFSVRDLKVQDMKLICAKKGMRGSLRKFSHTRHTTSAHPIDIHTYHPHHLNTTTYSIIIVQNIRLCTFGGDTSAFYRVQSM